METGNHTMRKIWICSTCAELLSVHDGEGSPVDAHAIQCSGGPALHVELHPLPLFGSWVAVVSGELYCCPAWEDGSPAGEPALESLTGVDAGCTHFLAAANAVLGSTFDGGLEDCDCGPEQRAIFDEPARYSTDNDEPGETFTMAEFLAANADDPLDPEDMAQIEALPVGGHVLLNLGAHGVVTIRRERS